MPILAGVAAVLMVLWATRTDGVELTTDSVTYLSTGENLASGGGFTTFEGKRLVDFPPVLPSAIAVIDIVSPNFNLGIRVFMALTLGGTVVVAGYWIKSYISNELLVLTAHTMLVFAPVLLYTHSTLSTEPLFILMSVSALWLASRATKKPSRRVILALGLLVAAAILTRYVGVVLIPTILILFVFVNESRARRVENATLFAIAAGSPLLIWLLFNYSIEGSFFGDRGPSDIGFASNVRAELSTLGQWLFSTRIGKTIRIVAMIVLLMPVGAAVIRSRRDLYDKSRTDGVLVLAIFVFFFLAYVAVLRSIVGFDALETRILSPIYVTIVLIFVWVAERLQRSKDGFLIMTGRYAVAFAVGIALLTVARGLSATETISSTGSDYTRSELNPFRESPIVNDPPQGDLYSNDPWMVYLITREEVKLSPREHVYASKTAEVEDIAELQEVVGSGTPTYLLWGNVPKRGYVASLEAIEDEFSLSLISEDEYWALYSIGLP